MHSTWHNDFYSQILDAMSYISQFTQRNVHLRPSNIFIDSTMDDRLKIGDIGLVTGYNYSGKLKFYNTILFVKLNCQYLQAKLISVPSST